MKDFAFQKLVQKKLISPKGCAVITPYHSENVEILKTCYASCRSQGIKLTHIFIADGLPNKDIDQWDIEHLILPKGNTDGGNTPRSIGSIYACNQGYWPIFYLDVDNYYEPWHVVEALKLKAKNPKADVLAMKRQMILKTKDYSFPISEQDSSGKHVDTSCYVFYPSSFRVLPFMGMLPQTFGGIGDQFLLQEIHNQGLSIVSSSYQNITIRPSVIYNAHKYSCAYEHFGITPPTEGMRDLHLLDNELTQAFENLSLKDFQNLTGSKLKKFDPKTVKVTFV